MRSTAKVLGIVGGIFGVIMGIIAMFIGGAGVALGAEGGGTVVGLGFVAILFAVAGIVGGALAETHRTAAIVLFFVSGVLGFVCISAYWALPGILLIVGGILESTGGTRAVPTAAQVTHQPHWGARSSCAKCGIQNPLGVRFCNGCGAPLGAVPPASTQNR